MATATWRFSEVAVLDGMVDCAPMAYYQDVVVEYLREQRHIFLNTECCIQLNEGNPDVSGLHWYCDTVAINLRENVVYLCEVTYAKGLGALLKRLSQWNAHWPGVKNALIRDNNVPEDWPVRPWLFIPKEFMATAETKIKKFSSVPGQGGAMPFPEITALEDIVPWNPGRWPKMDATSSMMRGTTKDDQG
jgi:hypothetical protein